MKFLIPFATTVYTITDTKLSLFLSSWIGPKAYDVSAQDPTKDPSYLVVGERVHPPNEQRGFNPFRSTQRYVGI